MNPTSARGVRFEPVYWKWVHEGRKRDTRSGSSRDLAHDIANGFTGLQTDDGLHKGCSVGRSSAGAEPGDDVALAAASASHACSASEQTHPELMINFFARLRRRFRCFWRTGGMHELDISTGKCRFCRIDWDRLYKTNRPSDNR